MLSLKYVQVEIFIDLMVIKIKKNSFFFYFHVTFSKHMPFLGFLNWKLDVCVVHAS